MYDIILAHKMLSFRKGSANPSDERYLLLNRRKSLQTRLNILNELVD